MCLCFFVFEVNWKFIEKFPQSLHVNVFDTTVKHQMKQIVNHLGVFSEEKISLKTFRLKDFKIFALCSSHRVNHLFSDFNWRRIRFRISTQNESKVNVEHFSIAWYKQVLQVSITYSKEICDWAVSSATENIILHYKFWIFVDLLEFLQMLLDFDILKCLCFRNKLNVTIGFAAG